jgi:hypothetical protein
MEKYFFKFSYTCPEFLNSERNHHRVHIGVEEKYSRVSVSALSAGAYTTTLYVMVDTVKGVGVHPPPSPD